MEENSNYFYLDTSSETSPKSDEPRYCKNNVATPGATSLTYQPRARTNLEVTMLYAQAEVKVLPIVIVYIVRRNFNPLIEGEKTLF